MSPFITFDELVALARERSPFYRDLYGKLGKKPTLRDLPVVSQEDFWSAHQRDYKSVLTGALRDGIVVTSGGSTGAPKFSYFAMDEWPINHHLSGLAYATSGMQAGDRVGNLFGAGELYASFIGCTLSLRSYPAGVLQFPLATHAPDSLVIELMREFEIDTFAGVTSRLMRLVTSIEKAKADVKIRRFLYAGEPFFPAQRAYCERRFPGLDFRSIGYASIDSGFIGMAEPDALPGEHRALDLGGIMEIHDEETGEPIDEVGVPGRVIFTNLARRLMPIIRYPAGDMAEWLEPAGTPDRKFMLLGRSEEAARIAHENMHVADVRVLLEPFARELGLSGFQLVATTESDRRDKLTIRLAAQAPLDVCERLTPEILAAVEDHKPRYGAMVKVGTAHALALEWAKPEDLLTNPRSGKVRMVVDQRGLAV